LRCECFIASCAAIYNVFYPKRRVQQRKEEKAEAQAAKKQKRNDLSKADFLEKVNASEAAVRAGRQRTIQAQMCATAIENRAMGCLMVTSDLMPCPGPDANSTKACVSTGEAMFICQTCKKRWQCMCHHCHEFAQKNLSECFFCRLIVFSFIFLQQTK